MANTQKQIRVSSHTRQALKDKDMGQVITDAMKQYVNGSKTLKRIDIKALTKVNVALDAKVVAQFNQLAEDMGYSFDNAVRLILTEYLDSSSIQGNETDHALDHNQSQNPS